MAAGAGQGAGSGQMCTLSAELPLGADTIKSPSGIIIIPELVSGALVWILVASTQLRGTEMHQGWVMFVSVTFCVLSIIQLVLYLTGTAKQSSTWIHLDLALSMLAFTLYLSAAVLQVNATIAMFNVYIEQCGLGNTDIEEAILHLYRVNLAATVFAFLTTGLYAVSAFISIQRWKLN
ncbi:myelin and lymphocyte protein-like [Lethenteron reissneri]|uniref:myelin and lymphocyte protein-like n=1 Tax=Lethenteron reissneri TaxID=7753 RepID=UPI002AB67CE4|nr:myelin and lymphocyte protein-like [Lethenteron reissneri]